MWDRGAVGIRGGVEGRGQPEIADYGLIGDRRGAALVSHRGSIDWCCLPRFDSGSVFGRLLDWGGGGHCSIEAGGEPAERDYLDDALVLETRLRGEGGEARLLDFFPVPRGEDRPRIVRIVEGLEGEVEVALEIAPRFDYGQVRPWVRGDEGVFAAIGGDDGLLVRADGWQLEQPGRHDLRGRASVADGERLRLEIGYRRPVDLDSLDGIEPLDADAVDRCLEETLSWWRDWSGCFDGDVVEEFPAAARSALILKALTFEPTGAIAAAATTSLPEARRLSGERNWDYRYSWVRDSALAVRSLAELGCEADADAFRRFIERSAAGNARDLQILFGVGGERRLGEQQLEDLAGWNGAQPVRVGNQAAGQLQLDSFGQLVDQSWRWHRRGNSPDDDYWLFVADLVEAATENWQKPDKGLWEWRGEPRHFVHSKAHTWAAVDRGIKLAEDTGREVPDAWRRARDEIRAAIEADGYDEQGGVFTMEFDGEQMDAALLRLPTTGFLEWGDERMIRTADAVAKRLAFGGLLRRYDADDGMPEEGAFLACSFWLATCFARQGRRERARETFDRAASTANDLGLFSEEYDPEADRMLGNFPQALTHLSHVEAAVSLTRSAGDAEA